MEYGSNLWAWQGEELEHALDPARAFFWDPRTGKTREAVLHIQRLITERGVRKILVIAPQSVCDEVWTEELKNAGIMFVNAYHRSLAERRKAIENFRETIVPVVLLVNWDVLYRIVDDLVKFRPEVVIADEMHYAMSAGSKRTRALQRLGKIARYRRGLTGTPTPKHYLDLYSQYKFLDPSIFGTRKDNFVERYVELDYWGRPKRYLNLPELRSKMLAIASRVDRAEVWGDRPPQEISRSIQLPSVARGVYDELAEDLISKYGGLEIDATHRLTQLVRFQQITAGFVSDGRTVRWIHKAKIEAALEELKDLLDSDQHVVVFYHFTPEGQAYEAEIANTFGPNVIGRIGGDTPLALRSTLRDSFRNPASQLRVMLMQDSLGIGISLKSASYVIRTSYPLNYAHYKQSNDRVYEPNKPLTYINLHAPGTVDDFGRAVVTTKDTASHLLLDVGFEGAIKGTFNVQELQRTA